MYLHYKYDKNFHHSLIYSLTHSQWLDRSTVLIVCVDEKSKMATTGDVWVFSLRNRNLS